MQPSHKKDVDRSLRAVLGYSDLNVKDMCYSDLWDVISTTLQSSFHCIIAVIGDLRDAGPMDGMNLVT